MAEAGISLGSNLGDKSATLESALHRLAGAPGVELVARSSFYRTEPWGDADQDWFLNACALVRTELSPLELLRLCLAVERELGRDRTKSRRWGPRPIDLDVLFYDDVVLTSEELTLPHPHMFERAFVLVPLAEIAPQQMVSGRSIHEAAAGMDRTGIYICS